MKQILIAMAFGLALSAQARQPVTHVQHVVVVPVIKKPKLLRSNPFRFLSIRLANADPKEVPDDEVLATDRRRQDPTDPEIDLDDSVKLKLAQARLRAMARYQEIWG